MIGKTTVFRDFPTFSRAHLHLLSSHSFSSLIFFLQLFSSLTLTTSAFPSVHVVGSLTSKVPSTSVYPTTRGASKHFLGRCLNPPNLSKSPFQEMFGSQRTYPPKVSQQSLRSQRSFPHFCLTVSMLLLHRSLGC